MPRSRTSGGLRKRVANDPLGMKGQRTGERGGGSWSLCEGEGMSIRRSVVEESGTAETRASANGVTGEVRGGGVWAGR